ncbi:unnamed protein product, partial [Amoebophrya sp. A25]
GLQQSGDINSTNRRLGATMGSVEKNKEQDDSSSRSYRGAGQRTLAGAPPGDTPGGKNFKAKNAAGTTSGAKNTSGNKTATGGGRTTTRRPLD